MPTPGAEVTLLFGGDVTLGYHFEEYFDVQRAAGKSAIEMYDYGFAGVRPATDGVDFFVVNLECPFTQRGTKVAKNFNFRARPELVEVLRRGGVHAVSLANNHLMDYGVEGLRDTVATLDQAKIISFGAGTSAAAARKLAIVERNGVRIALLGYLFLGANPIEPAVIWAQGDKPGAAGHPTDISAVEKMVKEDIALALSKADAAIPFFHWGKEGDFAAQPYQVQLGRAAIDAGAAAVVGSHPHLLQGAELYRQRPIVYSLGNLVFGGNWNPRNKQAALFRVTLGKGGKLLQSELVPILTDNYPEQPMQPRLLQGEAASQLFRHVSEHSSGFETPLPLPKNP
jgi:poly-gamma-glutamate synthesis protein (capsule biosynthesis protein)